MSHRFKINKSPWKEGQSRVIKIKRASRKVSGGNSGPSGRMKAAKRHYRALADMAAAHGVVNGKRKAGVKVR